MARASDRRNNQVKQYKKVMALSQKVDVNKLKRLHVTVYLRIWGWTKGLEFIPYAFNRLNVQFFLCSHNTKHHAVNTSLMKNLVIPDVLFFMPKSNSIVKFPSKLQNFSIYNVYWHITSNKAYVFLTCYFSILFVAFSNSLPFFFFNSKVFMHSFRCQYWQIYFLLPTKRFSFKDSKQDWNSKVIFWKFWLSWLKSLKSAMKFYIKINICTVAHDVGRYVRVGVREGTWLSFRHTNFSFWQILYTLFFMTNIMNYSEDLIQQCIKTLCKILWTIT